jgi:hypothetical protein
MSIHDDVAPQVLIFETTPVHVPLVLSVELTGESRLGKSNVKLRLGTKLTANIRAESNSAPYGYSLVQSPIRVNGMDTVR